MVLLGMWMLVASMVAYFQAMKLAYEQHEANAMAKKKTVWDRLWGWLSY